MKNEARYPAVVRLIDEQRLRDSAGASYFRNENRIGRLNGNMGAESPVGRHPGIPGLFVWEL
jgi:hypothetical protein